MYYSLWRFLTGNVGNRSNQLEINGLRRLSMWERCGGWGPRCVFFGLAIKKLSFSRQLQPRQPCTLNPSPWHPILFAPAQGFHIGTKKSHPLTSKRNNFILYNLFFC